MQTIEIGQSGGVVTLFLNRPDHHNALNAQMVDELTSTISELSHSDEIRVVVLSGRGRSFCAGADLATMRAVADKSLRENAADGQAIFDLMQAVDSCPKPVIGRVNGAAIGGGVGLVSCCDIVVAVERAKFGFSEVRLGIVPAVISPFVLAKIGATNGRELFLTGERISARQAQAIGLVHHVVTEEDLDAKVNERVEQLLQAAPRAQAAAKELIANVAGQEKGAMRDYTVQLIAQRRVSAEGREGMSAFLEKRKPNWRPS